jgi:hypothetical protein
MKQSLQLIGQLIEMEIEREARWKNLMISVGKGREAVGDSAMLTHLRTLKELIQKERPDFIIPVGVKLDVEPKIENTCCGNGGCGCHEQEVFVQSDGGGLLPMHLTSLPDFPKDGVL